MYKYLASDASGGNRPSPSPSPSPGGDNLQNWLNNLYKNIDWDKIIENAPKPPTGTSGNLKDVFDVRDKPESILNYYVAQKILTQQGVW